MSDDRIVEKPGGAVLPTCAACDDRVSWIIGARCPACGRRGDVILEMPPASSPPARKVAVLLWWVHFQLVVVIAAFVFIVREEWAFGYQLAVWIVTGGTLLLGMWYQQYLNPRDQYLEPPDPEN